MKNEETCPGCGSVTSIVTRPIGKKRYVMVRICHGCGKERRLGETVAHVRRSGKLKEERY